MRCPINQQLPPQLKLALAERDLTFDDREAFEQALEQARVAVGYNPTAERHYNYAVLLAAQGQYAEALPHLDKAIALRPGYVQALVERGLARAMLERYDQAMLDLMIAIREDAGYYRSWASRAAVHAQRGMWSNVVSDASRAIRLNPACAPAYKLRAIGHKLNGEVEAAIADFRTFLDLDRSGLDHDQIEVDLAALEQRRSNPGLWESLSRRFRRR